MICAQTRFPGVSVSQVARRYDVNANQVFNWLRDPKFRSQLDDSDARRFLPVEVVSAVRPDEAPAVAQGGIEVELSSGHRLSIFGPYDPEALARLIRGLSE